MHGSDLNCQRKTAMRGGGANRRITKQNWQKVRKTFASAGGLGGKFHRTEKLTETIERRK